MTGEIGVDIEQNNQGFSLNNFLLIQEEARQLLEKIFSQISVGMNYLDVERLVLNEYEKIDVKKNWHPVKVRIDGDTILTFREKSDPSKEIDNGSIVFVDLGYVKKGLEADIGRTFVFGKNENYEELIAKCESVFKQTIIYWRENQASGQELYSFAEKKCIELGIELNMKMDGHRLGSFPHGVFYQGGVGEIDFCPSKDCWILEIQVKDSELGVGAFYEDLIR